MNVSHLCRIVGAPLLGLAVQAAVAQGGPPTAEQVGKDPNALRQEAEQRRAQQQQRDQQRQSQQQADQQYDDALRQQQSRAAGDIAQAEAVRRTWQQRPPLAPEKNPLLGRWESLGTGQRKGGAPGLSPEMAQLANAMIGGLTGGLCDSMLGRGTIEFRPAGLVAIGGDGLARPMYRAEYRGGGSRVVVLPQGGTTFTHMIIDFDGADRATVAAVGCGLARAGGGASPPASTQAAAQAGRFGGSWNTRWGDGQAVLDLVQIGAEVTGAYAGSSRGKVTGKIAGNVLTGHWAGGAPDDNGGFVLNFSPDGKSFTGTWGTGASRNNGGPWVGTRR
ncbi:MAG TPA: hypothetical protein VFU71_22290 [Burkholderiaceae bacterium]|nr:hypothetical protein [Burkholderiaceae bacterium]